MKKRISLLLIFLFSSTIVQPQTQNSLHNDYRAALRLMGARQDVQAIHTLKQIINRAPDFYLAYKKLYIASERSKQLKDVEIYFSSLLNRNPNNHYAKWGQAQVAIGRGEYERAIDDLKAALRMGVGQPEIYEDLALAYRRSDRIEDAVQFLEQWINEHPGDAMAMYGLGNVYRIKGNWEQAIHWAEKTILFDRKLHRAYYLKGWIEEHNGYANKAIETLRAGEKVVLAAQNDEQHAKFLRLISMTQCRLGDFDQAFENGRKSLDVFEQTGDKKWIETILGDLGMYYLEIGDYKIAEDYLNRAYRIAVEIENTRDQSRHLNNLGLIYRNTGQFTRALDTYQTALDIDRESDEKRGESIRLTNIGMTYVELGMLEKALSFQQQALQITRDIGAKRSETISLANIGAIHYKMGNDSLAMGSYIQALALAHEIGYKKNAISAQEMIGQLNASAGNYQQAIREMKQALTAAIRIQDRRSQGSILTRMGQCYSDMSKYDKAIAYFQKALSIGHELKEVSINITAGIGIAGVFEAQGIYTNAVRYYADAIQEIESVRQELASDELRLSFLENRMDAYDRIIALLVKMHNEYPDKGYDRQAFQYAERSKARALLDMLYAGKIMPHLDEIPDSLRQQFLINRTQLEQKHVTLADEFSKPWEERSDSLIAYLENDIEILNRRKIQISESFKSQFPRFHELTNPKTLTAADIQRHILARNQVLVEYHVGTDQTIIWVITPSALRTITMPVGRDSLRNMLAEVSPLFQREKNSAPIHQDHRWANIDIELLHELHELLIGAPGINLVTPGCELIIIPHDILCYLPFGLLVEAKTADTPRYLIEQHAVSYGVSASSLLPELQEDNSPTKELLAFGNPEFVSEQQSGRNRWLETWASMSAMFRDDHFSPLPYAEEEVKTIYSQFSNSTVYTGRDATESRFKELADQYRYIHVASHHLTNDEQPMYSKMVFSQVGDSTNDGFLYTYEVYNLQLNAEMVVLSGCSTGLGRFTMGEGLIGMTRAFLYAGVPNLVVSLWSVQDESTANLMEAFYRNLNDGMSTPKALQEAKKKLIHSTDVQSNPYYWGAFILIGSNR